MSLKKFFIFLLIITCYLNSFAENIKIGLILPNYEESFYNNLRKSLESKSATNKFEIISLNSENDISKEINNVEKLIMNNVDIIVIRPLDSEKSRNALKAANINKTSLILLEIKDENINYDSLIKFNYNSIGNEIGEYLIKELKEPKNKLVELKFIDDEEINKKISNDLKRKISNEIEIISDKKIKYDDNKGINSIKDIIINHHQIDAILAYNDFLAMSTLKVLKAAGKKNIKIISIGSSDKVEKAYKARDIAAIVMKNSNEFSNKILEVSNNIIKKQEYEKEINIDVYLLK